MNAPNHLVESEHEWVVTNQKGETLTIHVEEVLSDITHDLGDDPGLSKDGVEKTLQALLAERPATIEEGLEMLEREYMTDLGPVDLLCRDSGGQVVAVEIKRKGELTGVEQLTRYLEFLNKDSALAPVRGILAAQSITPQARDPGGGSRDRLRRGRLRLPARAGGDDAAVVRTLRGSCGAVVRSQRASCCGVVTRLTDIGPWGVLELSVPRRRNPRPDGQRITDNG